MTWRAMSFCVLALMLTSCALAETGAPIASAPAPCASHPAWQAFAREFISADGRVIDASTEAMITTSEGQSYALFFALVNDDRARFKQLIDWTENNLAAGDLLARLPAWSWGRSANGQWRVLDSNAASDSDVWIAYSLLAAAERWSDARYRAMGLALATRIVALESVELANYGRVLLPGPSGFHPTENTWRLNPSYWPISVLRGLAEYTGDAAWQAMVHSSEALMRASAPKAVAPDWFVLNSATGALTWPATDSPNEGAYNAIRVYLWLGMMPLVDPLSASLRSHFAPWATRALARGSVPERLSVRDGAVLSDYQPVGFAQAALPFLQLQAERHEVAGLAAIEARAKQPREGYYNAVLSLFSELWRSQRFYFQRDGRLQLAAECL
ncbi:endoglucanase [Paraperlucidibaca baekdonensis]|uniref:cellulase n=1 Tax=Paraperlucidibaca baekdonensis TaxID=748120 RepID=A0A3E0HA03_9GAMM|nr:cellulose synthase complex periplasmic endoglucanase BcsZ [Paraperlucidibaca baekdonensis]REH40536.1 endoglucanase [Paraperlucidibaca baekdonensis]